MGLTLRTLRIKRGYSQDQVAGRMRLAGFSWQQTTVAKTEAGQRPIRVNEAVTLAKMFDVTLSYLLAPRHEDADEHQLRIMEARSALDTARYQVAEAHAGLIRAKEARDEAELRLHEAIALAEEAGVSVEEKPAATNMASDAEPPS